ncbi:MAG: type II toxin-antitoxin system RelE/ParE family toxin [Bacteroidales bacterium]|nr:type II toxin-antitoxin system RelE/ParE family toxin [Bacteroidales bacterium]
MNTAFKASFLKAIEKIRDMQLKSEVAQIIEKIEAADDLRSIANLKKMKGRRKHYRIKVGDYRIGLKIIDNVVFFVDLAHRKDIYKHFP